MDTAVTLALVAAGLFLLWLLLKILKTPLKWALKLLLHIALGFVGLFALNFFGAFIGVSLGLNWLNALVAGVLGVPGVLLLLLFKYIL